MTGRAAYVATSAVGVVLAALPAAALPWLLGRCERGELRVHTAAPAFAPALEVAASGPSDLAGRVRLLVDGHPLPGDSRSDPWSVPPGQESGPGMHRVEWRVDYRGGFTHRVGTTQLVGPFQDPGDPPCSLWLVVGQRFLDGGDPDRGPAPGSLAELVTDLVARELSGFDRWPLGAFERVAGLGMRWVAVPDIDSAGERERIRALADAGRVPGLPGPLDRAWRAASAPAGVLRTTLTLEFENGAVPLRIVFLPEFGARSVTLRAEVTAELDLDNRIYQWVADFFDGDDVATRIAQRELDAALDDAFGVPPPIPVSDRHSLRFTYCPGATLEVVTGRYAAVPMRLAGWQPGPETGPKTGLEVRPKTGPNRWAPAIALRRPDGQRPGRVLASDAPLALVFELDAVNGVLHQLWRSGFLDEKLAAAGLAARFNDDELVRQLVSVRLGAPSLWLPPTLELGRACLPPAGPAAPDLSLALEVALSIRDGDVVTPARVFGAVGFEFGDRAPAGLIARLQLDELAVTCHPEPDVLEPCYANLVAALRDRAGEVHGALSDQFTALFETIALGRTVDLQEARFRIDRAAVHTAPAPPTGLVRIDLHGRLHRTGR